MVVVKAPNLMMRGKCREESPLPPSLIPSYAFLRFDWCPGGWHIFVDLDFQTCCEFPAAVMQCESSIFQFLVEFFIYRISHTPQASTPPLHDFLAAAYASPRGPPSNHREEILQPTNGEARGVCKLAQHAPPLVGWEGVHVRKRGGEGLYSSRHLPLIIKVGALTTTKIPCSTLYR